jgi:hypothetical protein
LSQPVSGIQYRPKTGPGVLALRQERCWRRFVKAMASLTPKQHELLTLVGLLNIRVARIARRAVSLPPT